VGLCAERSLELMVALLGILKAGGAYLPLDPSYPAERLGAMLADAAVPGLLVAGPPLGRLPAPRARGVLLRGRRVTAGVGSVPPPAPENLAYVIFTSGSTGRPKGVMSSHRGIVNRLLWAQERYGLSSADRVLQKTPYSFDVSVWELFWPLLSGSCLVFAAPGGHQDSAYLVRTIAAEEITVSHFVPSMLGAFLAEPGLESCTALRRGVGGGEGVGPGLFPQPVAPPPARALGQLCRPTPAAVQGPARE